MRHAKRRIHAGLVFPSADRAIHGLTRSQEALPHIPCLVDSRESRPVRIWRVKFEMGWLRLDKGCGIGIAVWPSFNRF